MVVVLDGLCGGVVVVTIMVMTVVEVMRTDYDDSMMITVLMN